jgi:hypothetical protein
VRRAKIVVLAAILLLVRLAEMQIVDKPRTFELYLLHLQWPLTNKILLRKLWLQ